MLISAGAGGCTGSEVVSGTITVNPSTSASFFSGVGQNPTFCGHLRTSEKGTYTDQNGIGEFKYEPPAGFLALCTKNLPEPTIKNSRDYFSVTSYSGTGGRQAVDVGLEADLAWIKCTSNSGSDFLTLPACISSDNQSVAPLRSGCMPSIALVNTGGPRRVTSRSRPSNSGRLLANLKTLLTTDSILSHPRELFLIASSRDSDKSNIA